MDGLSQEKIGYLREFITELHGILPHGGPEENEHFLDDVINSGKGQYWFWLHGSPNMHGQINVSDGNVEITIDHLAIMPTEVYYNQLASIAHDTGVEIYDLPYNPDAIDRTLLGFKSIPIFPKGGSKLTIEEFITKYQFNVRAAAEKVEILENIYLGLTNTETAR